MCLLVILSSFLAVVLEVFTQPGKERAQLPGAPFPQCRQPPRRCSPPGSPLKLWLGKAWTPGTVSCSTNGLSSGDEEALGPPGLPSNGVGGKGRRDRLSWPQGATLPARVVCPPGRAGGRALVEHPRQYHAGGRGSCPRASAQGTCLGKCLG